MKSLDLIRMEVRDIVENQRIDDHRDFFLSSAIRVDNEGVVVRFPFKTDFRLYLHQYNFLVSSRESNTHVSVVYKPVHEEWRSCNVRDFFILNELAIAIAPDLITHMRGPRAPYAPPRIARSFSIGTQTNGNQSEEDIDKDEWMELEKLKSYRRRTRFVR